MPRTLEGNVGKYSVENAEVVWKEHNKQLYAVESSEGRRRSDEQEFHHFVETESSEKIIHNKRRFVTGDD